MEVGMADVRKSAGNPALPSVSWLAQPMTRAASRVAKLAFTRTKIARTASHHVPKLPDWAADDLGLGGRKAAHQAADRQTHAEAALRYGLVRGLWW